MYTTIHQAALERRLHALKLMSRADLECRLSFLEMATTEADARHIEWRHDVAAPNDQRLTVTEQIALIQQALREKTDDKAHFELVVGISAGQPVVKTL